MCMTRKTLSILLKCLYGPLNTSKGGVMLFNFLKRNNPPTERCKLLKEKVLDVVKPKFILGYWRWGQDPVRMVYSPEYHSIIVYAENGWVDLTKKESKWLGAQAEKVVSRVEEQAVEELLEKLRAL